MIIALFLVLALMPTSFALGEAVECPQKAGVLPDPQRPVGVADHKNPIEHIVVMMQENHSFDEYFGHLNLPQFYGNEVDGIKSDMFNYTSSGERAYVRRHSTICPENPHHEWNPIHREWNGGAMNGFARVNGTNAMGFYDHRDLPFYYDIANKFAISDRYFAATLTQTFPNRYYLYAGTSFGRTNNRYPVPLLQYQQKTLFDQLNEKGISWKYYHRGWGYLVLFQPLYLANQGHMAPVEEFAQDIKKGKLPQVVFIDSDPEREDEHPPNNVQVGQAFVAARLQELTDSPYWPKSVFFLAYDESGGFFDHVAPPKACVPDEIEPILSEDKVQGRFDRHGIRVPLVVVSPYAKHHYVSHQVHDHTSILRFIAYKFNLPALTARDANADPMLDLFDFAHPDFMTKPNIFLAQINECEEES